MTKKILINKVKLKNIYIASDKKKMFLSKNQQNHTSYKIIFLNRYVEYNKLLIDKKKT